MGNMKYAIVYRDRTGWWAVECRDSGKRIGGLCDSELDAYKLANSEGYLVR